MSEPGVTPPQALTRQQELDELERVLRATRIILENAVNEDVAAAAIELARTVVTRTERSVALLGDAGPPPRAPRSEREVDLARWYGLAA